MNKYIFNCTKQLNLTRKQTEILEFVASQLRKVKQMEPKIEEIAVPAGFVVDTLFSLKPNDIDIKYSIRDSRGNLSTECKCDYVMSLVQKTKLSEKYEVEAENILEENHTPTKTIAEKHLGIFSRHTDFISMFMMDGKGEVWCNKDSLDAFRKRVFESRTAGQMAWIYYRKRTYYQTLAIHLVRGFGYIMKRDLKMGNRFRQYTENAVPIFKRFPKESEKRKKTRLYFLKKVKSSQNLRGLLEEHSINGKEEIVDTIEKALEL